MFMKLFQQIIALIGLLIFSALVFASNFSFFGNSAISFFSKEDWRISKSAQAIALNQTQDGVKLVWTNPKTGTHGIFLPIHTMHAHGAVCRDLEILHTANQVDDKAIYRFCKLHDQWKIV